MKSMISVLLVSLVLLTPDFSSGQPAFHQGSWELNFTGSLGSINTSSDYSSPYYSNTESKDYTYFQIGIIPGYYLTQGLAFQPEINIFALEKSPPAFMLLANVAYTFTIEKSMFYPFGYVGYGVSNAFQIPVNNIGISRMTNDLEIGVLNLGAGVKTKLTKSVLLRTEINYRKYSYSPDEDMPGATYSMSLSSIALVFGFSILL
jgi:opacity protein-like surface antigen